MRSTDTLSMCFRNLYKRKLRTFLTLLGVIIGTGSIIVMISLGLATDAQFAQMIEDLDLDMTVVHVWPQWGNMRWDEDTQTIVEAEERMITEDSVAAIRRIPNVVAATPLMSSHLLFRSGPYAMTASVRGVDPQAFAMMGHNIEIGRGLSPDGEFEAVFSPWSEREFFDTMGNQTWSDRWGLEEAEELVDIFGDPIRIYYDMSRFFMTIHGRGGMDDDFAGMDIEEAFTPVRSFDINVVGLIAPQPPSPWTWGQSSTIYMDIETLQLLNQLQYDTRRRQQEESEFHAHFSAGSEGPEETFNDVWVRAASIDDTHDVAAAIIAMGYNARFEGRWIENERESQRAVETLLSAIAMVSLAVAAINIANTMITSVTERTREIGVMKVIGASIADIRKLFLLESAVIGLIGGLFGIGLALGMSYAMNNFDIPFLANLGMGAPMFGMEAERRTISLITPQLCALALLIAGGVGLVSGFYPAFRATRLSALAAIRGD